MQLSRVPLAELTIDDIAQGCQRFVDVLRLLQSSTTRICFGNSFTPRQIHHHQFPAHFNVLLDLQTVDVDQQQTMGPTGMFIGFSRTEKKTNGQTCETKTVPTMHSEKQNKQTKQALTNRWKHLIQADSSIIFTFCATGGSVFLPPLHDVMDVVGAIHRQMRRAHHFVPVRKQKRTVEGAIGTRL